MKTYPNIQKQRPSGTTAYAFGKLDGSNIRAEISRKRGEFYKFGRREGLLDHSNPILLRAPDLIRAKYEKAVAKLVEKERWQSAICFFEFFGPGSAFGVHPEAEQQDVVLIDIAVDKRGLLEPSTLLKACGDTIETAPMLYHGLIDGAFSDAVEASALDGMPFEGVVCKAGYKSPGLPLMWKIKSRAWLAKLREHCHGDERLFEKLS